MRAGFLLPPDLSSLLPDLLNYEKPTLNHLDTSLGSPVCKTSFNNSIKTLNIAYGEKSQHTQTKLERKNFFL